MADEIIEELWRVKEEIAREHGNDVRAIAAYFQRKDREAGFRKVDPQNLKKMTEAGEVRQKRKNEFTAIMERDGDWFVAFCPEVPGANGQGKTWEEARENLAEAVALVLEDRLADGLRQASAEAIRGRIVLYEAEPMDSASKDDKKRVHGGN